jgi:hypothetical protein
VLLGELLYFLYDDELKSINPWDIYINDLRNDINAQHQNEHVISSFNVASSTDVIYSNMDGSDYATLNCLFTVRQSTNLFPLDHQFLLRRHENGRWMILGWQRDERFD